jgi:hypothetical protein
MKLIDNMSFGCSEWNIGVAINDPNVNPRNTKLPKIPREKFSSLRSSFSFKVAAGIIP